MPTTHHCPDCGADAPTTQPQGWGCGTPAPCCGALTGSALRNIPEPTPAFPQSCPNCGADMGWADNGSCPMACGH